MTVRTGRPDDLPTLRRLQRLLPDPTPELFAATRSEQILVSVDGTDRPVGYLLPIHGEDVHLAEAVVHPEFRRDGRGTRLFETAIDRADGARVTLLVAADNDAAIALYRKLGFATVERRPDAYADGPGLFMAREETS